MTIFNIHNYYYYHNLIFTISTFHCSKFWPPPKNLYNKFKIQNGGLQFKKKFMKQDFYENWYLKGFWVAKSKCDLRASKFEWRIHHDRLKLQKIDRFLWLCILKFVRALSLNIKIIQKFKINPKFLTVSNV